MRATLKKNFKGTEPDLLHSLETQEVAERKALDPQGGGGHGQVGQGRVICHRLRRRWR